MFEKISNTIVARLSEPSTWAGIAILLSSGMQAWNSKDVGALSTAVTGILAILLPERKNSD